ncbi:CRISPR-associated protein [Parabacteroides sp.]|uniref:CRISPR-associated protein n=1 Tax=Parabacteroides sp. TaxID=1869337 RepID=UPI003080CDE5
MFINISNHPFCDWSENQLAAARQFGEIVELPFPVVSASEGEDHIASLAKKYADEIISRYDSCHDVVHVMGEMCFSFALVKLLQQAGFVCVASTSDRVVKEVSPGHKEVFFKFIRFRQYGT